MMSPADKYHHHLPHLHQIPNMAITTTTATTTKLLTGAEEHRHYLRVFIQTYRDLPVLWDTSLRDYTNREKRADAYDQLVPIYRYLKRDATVDDVKKKINTLRTNYRKELKVVECARRSGSVHTPRCWTFPELDFLRNTEKFLAVNPHSRSTSAHHESSSSASFAAFNEQTNSSFMEHTPSATPSAYASFRTMLAQNPIAQSPTPSITEMFQKSFGGGHTHKLEPQQTTPPPQSSSLPGSVGYASAAHEVKRQRLTPPSGSNLAPQAQSTASSGGATNSEELLNIACDYLSGTFPEEESIARTWTHKLKRMQRDQRLLAEKFINEILFEGESATLHRGSVQINTFEPFVRFEDQQPNSEDNAKSQSPESTSSPAADAKAGINASGESTAAAAATAGSAEDNFRNYN